MTQDLAGILQGQQRTDPRDILALLQEMRARRTERSQSSATPMAGLLQQLLGSPDVQPADSWQSALGNQAAALQEDQMRRRMISDLTSGKLAPLDQLQQSPAGGGLNEDLASLGISPEDFRSLLGHKPTAAAAPAPLAPGTIKPPAMSGSAGLQDMDGTGLISAFLSRGNTGPEGQVASVGTPSQNPFGGLDPGMLADQGLSGTTSMKPPAKPKQKKTVGQKVRSKLNPKKYD